MIYLSIPQGMIFQKVTSKKEERGITTEETRDCFVDPEGNKPLIELQYLVKEALRSNMRHTKRIQLNVFTLYLSTPPCTLEVFLEYHPDHNGKYPTQIPPKQIIGRNVHKFDPSRESKYGTFWYQQIPLSPEKQQEIEQKMLEQKENRRHTGDNPFPT